MRKQRRQRASKARKAIDADVQRRSSSAGGIELSLSLLALELGCTRDTVRKVLVRANVPAAGHVRGNPIYRLRDVLRAWLSDPASGFDPDRLPPPMRVQHYRAEAERLQHFERAGLLCSALAVEQRVARLLKAVAQALDGIPDLLERDHGATPAMVAGVERSLDRLRTELHARTTAENGNGNGPRTPTAS